MLTGPNFYLSVLILLINFMVMISIDISLIDSTLPPIIGLSLGPYRSLILFSPTIIIIEFILGLFLDVHIHVYLVVILIITLIQPLHQ